MICGNPIQNLSTEIPNPLPPLQNSISPILRSALVATKAMCRVGKACEIISICGKAILGARCAIQNLRQRFGSRDIDSGMSASDSDVGAGDSPVENFDSDVSASESGFTDGDSPNCNRDSDGVTAIPECRRQILYVRYAILMG